VFSFCDALKDCRFSVGIAMLEYVQFAFLHRVIGIFFVIQKGIFSCFFMSPFFMIILLFLLSKTFRCDMFCRTCAKRVKKSFCMTYPKRVKKSLGQKRIARARARTFL